MNRTKILAVCLGLFTVMMTGLGADLESRAIKSVLKSYSHGASYGQLGTPALDDKIDIIRDQFRMFLIFGGAFGGAVVCVLLRLALTDPAKLKLTRTLLGAYFAVSLLSSIFCTPFLLKHYYTCQAEECFAGSFLLAASVWGLWEIVFVIIARLKQAAVDRGWAGVVGEVKGNTATVTATPPASPAVVAAATDPVPSAPVK